MNADKSRAEAGGLTGRFRDARSPVPAVRVRRVSLEDTTEVSEVTAGQDGSFEAHVLGSRVYRFEATRLGCEPLRINVRVAQTQQDLGILILTPSPIRASRGRLGESWSANAFGFTSGPVSWLSSIVTVDDGLSRARPRDRDGLDEVAALSYPFR